MVYDCQCACMELTVYQRVVGDCDGLHMYIFTFLGGGFFFRVVGWCGLVWVIGVCDGYADVG